MADGRFATCWTGFEYDSNGGESSYALFQLFDSNGKAASILYSLGAADGHQGNPSIAALANGRFAADWVQTNPKTGQPQIVSQIFDPRDHGIDLTGNALADQYAGSTYNDKIRGVAGDDTLFGDAVNYVLLGGSGSDKLFGFDGDDYLFGLDGDDRLVGGTGNDFEIGAAGAMFSSLRRAMAATGSRVLPMAPIGSTFQPMRLAMYPLRFAISPRPLMVSCSRPGRIRSLSRGWLWPI